ncbi:hypothetical protein BGX38DRAFT_1291923 [Terfezia claveryi]|nr:hypothetical protein BGX38DRAFT_1291923 [Terfezia claveryi]
MNADVRDENSSTQDYVLLSAQQPRKRRTLGIVKTTMQIMQDIDFADWYLKVVEIAVGEATGEEPEEPRNQGWMRRKKRIEMFQEEVWEAILEGKVENPFKRKTLNEKGDICDCEGLVPTKRPGSVPDSGVIADSYPGVPLPLVRNSASGGVEACTGRAPVGGSVGAPILVPSHSTLSIPPTQISILHTDPACNEPPGIDIADTDNQPAQSPINDELHNALNDGVTVPLPHLHPLVSTQLAIAGLNSDSASATTGKEEALRSKPQDDPERQFLKQAALWLREYLFTVRDEALRSQPSSLGGRIPTGRP